MMEEAETLEIGGDPVLWLAPEAASDSISAASRQANATSST